MESSTMNRNNISSPLFAEGLPEIERWTSSKDSITLESASYSYYPNWSDLLTYIADVAQHLFGYLQGFWSEPWPEWSWETTTCTTKEKLTAVDAQANFANNNLLQRISELAIRSIGQINLSDSLINAEGASSIVFKRVFHGHLLTELHVGAEYTSKPLTTLATYLRPLDQIRAWQRGTYIENTLYQEGKLWLTYGDDDVYIEKVLQKIKDKTKINLDKDFVKFLLLQPSNGCFNIYYDSDKSELCCSLGNIPEKNQDKLQGHINDFNNNCSQGPICNLEFNELQATLIFSVNR